MKGFTGFHYDIARGAYLRPERFHEAIRHAAACGYTHFLPYLENMIRLPSLERACPDCAYSPTVWREFEQTAKGCGIELVPHFNVIGHTENIAPAYPELTGGRGGGELDVSLPETRAWILRCLEEFCACSNAGNFLIGGDEWQTPDWLLTGQGDHVADLWVETINLAVEFLAAQGRVPIVWHDMLFHFPEALDRLSRESTVAFWFYDEDSDHAALRTLKERGFRTLMAAGCEGQLGRRHLRGMQRGLIAAQKHEADGFLMTSWEGTRWESQKALMTVVASVLDGKAPPPELVEAASIFGLLGKLDSDAPSRSRWLVRMQEVLSAPVWADFPEYQAYLGAVATQDAPAERTLYERHQYPSGPIYSRMGRRVPAHRPLEGHPPACPISSFSLDIEERPIEGPILTLQNGIERLTVYPKYGATLQDWTRAGFQIIPHTLPGFLKKTPVPAPGGYKSYKGVGGFRPIWALGTHHNPCIFWQHPFSWVVEEDSASRKEIVFACELSHASVTYRLILEAGQPGFVYEAEAVTRRDGLFGAFNFNLPLAITDWEAAALAWREKGISRTLRFSEVTDSAFWLDSGNQLDVVTKDGILRVTAEHGEYAGCYVDWAHPWGVITPDFHGVYRRLTKGEKVTVCWRFQLASADDCREAEAAGR